MTVYSTVEVLSAEAKSVDSMRMTPSHTNTGHHRCASMRKEGRSRWPWSKGGEAGLTIAELGSRLLNAVVGGFASDHHVVHVAFAQAGSADAHETRFLLQFGNR